MRQRRWTWMVPAFLGLACSSASEPTDEGASPDGPAPVRDGGGGAAWNDASTAKQDAASGGAAGTGGTGGTGGTTSPGTGGLAQGTGGGPPSDAGTIILTDASNRPDDQDPAWLRYPTTSEQSPITKRVVASMKAIVARASGQSPHVFMKAGDSITVNSGFMSCFTSPPTPASVAEADWRNYAGFTFIANTVSYFQQAVQGTTSFERVSNAAQVGQGSYWLSHGTPTPLDSEATALKPQFALIMIGTNDLALGGSMDPGTFQTKFSWYPRYLLESIDMLIARGIVPIMSSIPPRGDALPNQLVPSYNAIVRGIAQERRVPFVDVHKGLLPLPSYGLSDGTHPNAYVVNGFGVPCNFSSAALAYGGHNVRNLYNIGALERVRRVFGDGAAYLDDETAENTVAQAGTGTSADPYVIDQIPFVHVGDVKLATSNALSSYSGCSGAPAEPGPEVLYRFTIASPVRLRAFVSGYEGATIDYHVNLLRSVAGSGCMATHPVVFQGTLSAGTYYLTVDSSAAPKSGPSEYVFGVVACEADDATCDTPL